MGKRVKGKEGNPLEDKWFWNYRLNYGDESTKHWSFLFPNDYGISVVHTSLLLGDKEGKKYEAAIIHYSDGKDMYEVINGHPMLPDGHTTPSEDLWEIELLAKWVFNLKPGQLEKLTSEDVTLVDEVLRLEDKIRSYKPHLFKVEAQNGRFGVQLQIFDPSKKLVGAEQKVIQKQILRINVIMMSQMAWYTDLEDFLDVLKSLNNDCVIVRRELEKELLGGINGTSTFQRDP